MTALTASILLALILVVLMIMNGWSDGGRETPSGDNLEHEIPGVNMPGGPVPPAANPYARAQALIGLALKSENSVLRTASSDAPSALQPSTSERLLFLSKVPYDPVEAVRFLSNYKWLSSNAETQYQLAVLMAARIAPFKPPTSTWSFAHLQSNDG